ncbi:hypothetical protein B0H14DRAFT_3140749 [Mycena olivaceomarginata]|nr:hypothetical protein B0H14DRAFT_3140749 [Mycena olivaceomarginata]
MFLAFTLFSWQLCTELHKSQAVRARDKNPPNSNKPNAKPGPKPKQAHRTAARLQKDERHQDLIYVPDRDAGEHQILEYPLKEANEVALPLGSYLHKFRGAGGGGVEDSN